MIKTKYNTANENLCMWRCHPEKLCINCTSFTVSCDSKFDNFGMYCIAGFWDLSKADPRGGYVRCLMLARDCEEYEIDSCCHKDLEGY